MNHEYLSIDTGLLVVLSGSGTVSVVVSEQDTVFLNRFYLPG